MKKTQKRSTSKKKVVKKQHKKGFRNLLYQSRFIPALLIATFATILSIQQQVALHPQARNVLAFATNVSPSGLLTETNSQRVSNGASNLSANALLAAAAQAKANDMVTRNYWSHVTPDGKQPWWFITNAGYSYTAAGENLAYGFLTSNDTVTGWMNSPSHRENLLSKNFTEAGFGIANSENFTSSGQQTIVVAMYGAPSSTPVAAVKPAASTPSAKPVATKPAPTPPVVTEPEVIPQEEAITTATEVSENESINPITAAPATINRVQLMGNGGALWSASFVVMIVLSVGILWAFHKGLHLRRYVLAGEHILARHIHLDLTVLAVLYLGFVLLSDSGFVR
jgi:uncharacterized protein YkwD